MIKLCIPSGIGLAIISAIGGFLLNEVARSKAYTDAYTKAYGDAAKSVVDTVSEAAAARKEADINAQAAELSSKAAQSRAAEAKAQVDNLGRIINNADKSAQDLINQTRSNVESLATRSDFAQLVADKIQISGRILAIAQVRGRKLVYANQGTTFDPSSGTVTFQNPMNLKFVPVMSYISTNNAYATETVYSKSFGPNYVVVWQGAQDTSGNNHPPYDFTLAVLGYEQAQHRNSQEPMSKPLLRLPSSPNTR
jgi:hypothetical protein